MKISKRTYRQIKNMEKNCTFDFKNKVVCVPLHYETPDDLLAVHISRPGKPVVSDEAVDYLREIISSIPDEFSVEMTLSVDDYGEYDHEQLMDALRVTIENTYYYHDEKRRQTNVLSVFFLIIGFMALTIEVIGGFAGWFGEKGSMARSIIETIADVATWVFLWEGCALLFLTYENESTVFSQEMQRFHKVSFCDSKDKLLISMDKEQFYEGWVDVGKKEAFARGFILFSNAIFLASLVFQVVEMFALLGTLTTMDIILYVVSWVFILLLVISNVSFYLDKGRMKKYAPAFSIIVFIYNLISIILYAADYINNTTYFIFSCLFIAGLFVNILCIRYMKKQSVEI